MASELKVDKIYNKSGDGDSGVVLSTNDVVATHIAGTEQVRVHSDGTLAVSSSSETITKRKDPAGWNIQAASISGTATGAISANATGVSHQLGRQEDGKVLDIRRAGTLVGSISALGGERIALHTGTVGIEFNPSNQVNPSNGSGGLDDTLDLGASGARWDDVYATNGTIQTSDENEKQNIASFTTKELAVATKLSALFKTFKWKSKVTEKADKARTHSGIIAQTVKTTFASEGLDAANYGLFTSTTWTDADGKEQTRMGIRYPELFSFIFGSIEARLTALEAK